MVLLRTALPVFAIFIFFNIHSSHGRKGQDQTLVAGTKGEGIVEVVVERIRETCIFPDDRWFLRRLAYVESTDGKDSFTYRSGFHGGIWQVQETQYLATRHCRNIALQAVCSKIKQAFSIDWSNTTWEDLRKPMYSGLAASLYLLLRVNATGIPGKLDQQASFWKHYYHYGNSHNRDFIATIHKIDIGCQGKQVDLVFVIDGSGSIGSYNFNKIQRFLVSVVESLDISTKATHIAVVLFSSTASVSFYLDKYSDKASIIAAIKQIHYGGGSTNTAAAINVAANDVFTKGRDPSSTSRVLVLVTDGKSNYPQRTIQEASAAKKQGINIFAVGVGSIYMTELNAVSTDPKCTHVFIIKTFNEMSSLIFEIISTCRTPTVIIGTNTTITITKVVGINVTIDRIVIPDSANSSKGHLIVTEAHCAVVYIYAAYNTSKPSKVVYEFKGTSYTGHPSVLYIKKSIDGKPLHVRIESHTLNTTQMICENGTVNIEISKGKKSVEVICREHGMIRNCTATDIISSKWKNVICPTDGITDIENPCTKNAIRQGKLIFPYLHDNTKFLKCDMTGNVYVILCPIGLTFNGETGCGSIGTEITTTEKVPLPFCIFNPCNITAIENHHFFFPYPNDSHHFIHCDLWGKAWLKTCQKLFVWHKGFQTCVPENTIDFHTTPGYRIANPCTPEELAKGHFFFPHPNPHKYIHCDVAGNYWVQSCYKNQVYNPKLYNCM